MQFWKGHALGNDYIVLDGTGAAAPEPALVRRLCDRHRGVGGDGVLVADRDRDPVALRIFNPDGSEAEKSGNGLRIFGAWLHGQGHVDGSAAFQVALPSTTVEMHIEERTPDGTLRLRVDMGRVSFRAGDIPFTGADANAEVRGEALELEGGDAVDIHLVSLGNPHCVVFVDDLDIHRFRRLAPAIQAHAGFQRGVNVQFARPLEPALPSTVDPAAPAVLEARIWERGAGETLASGSSACAVAVAACRAGLASGHRFEVRMEGGSVMVEIDDEWRVHLTGEARMVYTGVLEEGWTGD